MGSFLCVNHHVSGTFANGVPARLRCAVDVLFHHEEKRATGKLSPYPNNLFVQLILLTFVFKPKFPF